LLAQRARGQREAIATQIDSGANEMWQTPTPVGGVAAARRPTPAPPKQPVQ